MLSGKRILVTGVTGKAVQPIAAALARDNEVLGLARFATPESREKVTQAGITPCPVDLDDPDFTNLPADVDYLLHFAWTRAGIDELDRAIRVNVEAAGLIFEHCRNAKAALVVSSQGVYAAHPDPWHEYTETDPIGSGATAWAPTSPATKLGLEAVGRFCARSFDLPMTIARLNTVLGPRNAFFGLHFDAVRAGRDIWLPGDPNVHCPIHTDDMILQIEPLLEAASSRATIVNWCGDEAVTAQQTLARTGALLGKEPKIRLLDNPCSPQGFANDTRLRRSITGPCTVTFEQGFETMAAAILAEPDGA